MPAKAESAATSAFRATDYLTGDEFTVGETAAGWWAVVPVPKDLGRYYPPVYYGGGGRRFPGPVEWLQDRLYGSRARRVTAAAGRVGRVLDVGCGPGHLLARFRNLGWDVLGTEATEASAELARRNYGLDVRAGELRALQFPAASFDAVVSWHTLEHMADPREVLDEMQRVLKPVGVLFLSVPNFSSPEAQANPAAWFHLDVPRHLVHFPAAVLRGELARRQFRIEDEHTYAPEYDAFSLTQTWQNRLGLPHNVLYLTLKSARRVSGRRDTLASRIAAVALAALMLPLAAMIVMWRAARKHGAVVVFLARKT